MVIIEKSTIKGLSGILNSMHIPKNDILVMELYYETERKKTYEQLEKSLKNAKAKLKEYRQKEKDMMDAIHEQLEQPTYEQDYNEP